MKYVSAALLASLAISAPVHSQVTIDLEKVFQNQSQTPRTADIEEMEKSVKIENIVFQKENESSTKRLNIFLDVTNMTDKTIAGIKLSVTALNIFGDRLDREHLIASDTDIEPGETASLKLLTIAEEYLASDQSKATLSAKPSHIVFSTGQILKSK